MDFTQQSHCTSVNMNMVICYKVIFLKCLQDPGNCCFSEILSQTNELVARTEDIFQTCRANVWNRICLRKISLNWKALLPKLIQEKVK